MTVYNEQPGINGISITLIVLLWDRKALLAALGGNPP
jgi:hypothetical protein